MSVVGISNGFVQRLVMNVVQAGIALAEASGGRAPLLNEPIKKLVHRLAAGDASERAVLAAQTDARIEHHCHEEPRLARSESVVRDGPDTLVPRHHSRNSSAISGSKGVPPPLDPPPTRLPLALNCEKPALAFAAACAPR